MGKYLFFIRENLNRYPLPDAELDRLIAAHVQWAKLLKEQGHFISGAGIGPEGTWLELKEGSIRESEIPDKEQGIGGFYLIEADSMEQAVALGKTCPTFADGDKLEIRPVM